MKRGTLLVVIFSTFPLLFSFAQNAEYTLNINSNGIEKSLTLGYHPFATNGIDTSLGEINLLPYTSNQFDARFRLFDTTLSSYKDFRFGCYWGFSTHILEWKYGNNIIISGAALDIRLYSIKIINPKNGNYLASFESPDSVYFNVPDEFDYVVIYASTPLPLSADPSYSITSIKKGELLPAGSSKLLIWTLNLGFPGYTDISLSTDNGNSWNFIAQDLLLSQTSFDWSVPNISSNQCIIRVGNYPCIYDEVGTFVIYQESQPQLSPIFIPFNLRNGNNEIVNLTAGLHPQATSGLDTSLEETIYNFDTSGIFDAAFRYVGFYPDQYSKKDFQYGHQLVYGSRRFYFHVLPSSDSIVVFEATLPKNIYAEIEYLKQLPYGSIPEKKYLGSGSISYQLPKSSLWLYNDFNVKLFFNNVLPVELLSFEGIVIDHDVHLEWATATEANNYGFEIQKRISPSNFTTIGFVDGHGTIAETCSYSFIDKNVSQGKYTYRLKQIDFDGSSTYSKAIEVEVSAPLKFELAQNYPNPFNPSTKIRYAIPLLGGDERGGFVTLKVYDILGNEVATLVNEHKPGGTYEVEFSAGQTFSLSSGVYYYQLRAGDFIETKKMILVK